MTGMAPGLEDRLHALSLRMLDEEVAGAATDDGLLPLDVDRGRREAATLIARLLPRGVTFLHVTGLIRHRGMWSSRAMGSQLLTEFHRPAGDRYTGLGETTHLVRSGLMPWSGRYLCCRSLVAGQDLRLVRIGPRTRPVPEHGQLVLCWRSHQRITGWGPGIAVRSGPGHPPRMAGIAEDGRQRPITFGPPPGR